MVVLETEITTYLMPDDADVARRRLLDLITTPSEKWLLMYEASMAAFWEAITAGHAAAHPAHVYADASLGKRPNEHASLVKLKKAGVDVVLGSSNTGRYFICHSKVVAVSATATGEHAWNWEGSTNFSETSWAECNTAIVFQGDPYRDAVRNQFDRLAAYARSVEPEFQL